MKLIETPNAHSCKYLFGKIVTVTTDSFKNFYCIRCGRKLLNTQVADKWMRGERIWKR
jgi:hypothetical protein